MSAIYNLTGSTLNIFQNSQLDGINKFHIKDGEVPYRVFESLVEFHTVSVSYGGVSNDRGDDGESPICIYTEEMPNINFDFNIVESDDIVIVNSNCILAFTKKFPNVNFARATHPVKDSNDKLVGFLGISVAK